MSRSQLCRRQEGGCYHCLCARFGEAKLRNSSQLQVLHHSVFISISMAWYLWCFKSTWTLNFSIQTLDSFTSVWPNKTVRRSSCASCEQDEWKVVKSPMCSWDFSASVRNVGLWKQSNFLAYVTQRTIHETQRQPLLTLPSVTKLQTDNWSAQTDLVLLCGYPSLVSRHLHDTVSSDRSGDTITCTGDVKESSGENVSCGQSFREPWVAAKPPQWQDDM